MVAHSKLTLPTRILIAELDSVAQKERYLASGVEAATQQLTGMLRVGRLISDSVLVTDAMLLDGNYFIRLGPAGVLRELGASDGRFPLIITGPAKTLAEGLAFRMQSEKFEWSLIGVGPGGVPSDGVRARWGEWLDYVERGLIRYEQQPQTFAITENTELPVALGEHDVVLEKLRPVVGRSEARKLINEADLSDRDRNALYVWWNGRYLRAIAEQASADWVSFEQSGAEQLANHSRNKHIRLPERLLEWARDSNPASIGLAWDATAAHRGRLHRRGSWSAMRDLAYQATEVAAASTRRKMFIGSILKLTVAALAIMLALPGLGEDALDSPVTWMLFAGVIATTVPFESLGALWGLAKRDAHAELVLHEGRRADV